MYADPRNQRDAYPNWKREYSPIFYCSADWVGMDGWGSNMGRVGWWANGFFREPSWRINGAVTPVEWDTILNQPYLVFGQKVTVRNPSAKVLFIESMNEGVSGDRWTVVNANGSLGAWGAGVL